VKKKGHAFACPRLFCPEIGKLGNVAWNDPVEPEGTRPLERRWPKEGPVLLERLELPEPRVLRLLQVLPWRVLLLVQPRLVQPRLVLLAPEGQWWSFRRFLR
jgi:hypothetical protein